jgi:predicted transcriptional regulator
LSIKPEYVDKILQGTKKYEFRRRIAKDTIDAIYIYSTYPTMKIVAKVEVLGVLFAAPSTLWENTKFAAGISRRKFREYFKGCKTAYAYKLGNLHIFDHPRSLQEFDIPVAPQSFVYINNDVSFFLENKGI